MLYFFFQAEDGIRDYKVTGVQTCALPIYGGERGEHAAADVLETEGVVERRRRLDREVAQIDRRGRARGGGCGAGGGEEVFEQRRGGDRAPPTVGRRAREHDTCGRGGKSEGQEQWLALGGGGAVRAVDVERPGPATAARGQRAGGGGALVRTEQGI